VHVDRPYLCLAAFMPTGECHPESRTTCYVGNTEPPLLLCQEHFIRQLRIWLIGSPKVFLSSRGYWGIGSDTHHDGLDLACQGEDP